MPSLPYHSEDKKRSLDKMSTQGFVLLFSHPVVSHSLWPQGLQHARLPCSSLSPGVCSDSWPLNQSVTLSNHLILCHPLLLPPSIFPSIRAFSSESVLCIRWPKYWSFSFNISPSNEYFRVDLLQDWLVGSACSPRDSQESFPIWKHQFFSARLSLWSNSHIHTWLLEKP